MFYLSMAIDGESVESSKLAYLDKTRAVVTPSVTKHLDASIEGLILVGITRFSPSLHRTSSGASVAALRMTTLNSLSERSL